MKEKYFTMNEARKYLEVSANGLRGMIILYKLTVYAPPDAPWKRKYLLQKEVKNLKRQRKPRTPVEDTERHSKYIDSKGYVCIYRPFHPRSRITGYVYEHLLVMEEHLGRILTEEETVHHIDGNTQNNAISNLKIFPTKGAHLKYGHKTHFRLKHYLYKLELAKSNKAVEKLLSELTKELKTIYKKKILK